MKWLLRTVLVAGLAASGCGAEPARLDQPFEAGILSRADGAAGDAGATADPDAPSLEDACALFAEQYCGWFERCLPQNIRAGYHDVATCIESTSLRCTSEMTLVGTNQTPSRTQACGRALATLTCDAFPMLHLWPESCTEPAGKLPDGAKCLVSAQCQGGACRSQGYFCGVCASHSPIGGRCLNDDDCQSGLCENSVCVPAPALGEPCNLSRLKCAGNTLCKVVGDVNAIGVCVKPVARGAACERWEFLDPCDFWHNDYCEVESGTCQTGGIWAKPIGSPCTTQDCSPTGCVQSASCEEGVCTALPRVGEPCHIGRGGCLAPAGCVRGVCAIVTAPLCE